MNVLFVGAHHDDLEVSVGGTVARWSQEGHRIFSAILTDSMWTGPDGRDFRNWSDIERYTQHAADILGYFPINLRRCRCLELQSRDEHVVAILKLISEHAIDTMIALSPNDAHPDHRAAAEIAINASRRVRRVLLTRVSWNSYPVAFKPNYFVDVTDHWSPRLASLRCFQDEYQRTGKAWETFVESTSKLYGLETGCDRAEGFEVLKIRE